MSLTAIPKELFIGDQWEWTVSNGTYPASDSWVMSYVLINASNKVVIASSADGDNHVVDYSSSSEITGGYRYQQYFTKAGERKTVDNGYVSISPNFSAEATFDDRSHVKKVLDAIEATLEGVASKSQQSYSIEGRSLSRYSLTELTDLRSEYRKLWTSELRQAAVNNGESPGGRVQIKMGA